MVIPGEATSNKYLGNDDGAPPLPPKGGYRGAKRAKSPELPAGAPVPTRTPEESKALKRKWIGIGSFVAAIIFGVVLLIVMVSGGSHALYTFNMLALQFAVLALILVALVSPGARAWGSAALAVTLVANIATIGAAGALTSAQTGNYENLKTDKQKFWEKYPGIKGDDASYVLQGPTVEELRTESETVSQQIKDRLSTDFGFTWATPAAEMERPIRNGYGGESWFFTYTSEKNMTNEAVHGEVDKLAVLAAINDVVANTEYGELYAMNEPGYRSDDVLEQIYGSADPAEQVIWEYYSSSWETPLAMYVTFVDLSKDETGKFRTERESWQQKSGEQLEGVSIYFVSTATISEDDIDAFETLMKDYE